MPTAWLAVNDPAVHLARGALGADLYRLTWRFALAVSSLATVVRGSTRREVYRDCNKMMAVDVSSETASRVLLSATALRTAVHLGTGQTVPNYDVSPDGQRCAADVVLNGFDDLTRLALHPDEE